METHVLGIRAAFPLSHQAQAGTQANAAAGGGIESYGVTGFNISYSSTRGDNSAGAVAADNMWEV
jgi:hypothetical protein